MANVVLYGAERSYRFDCASQDAILRLEEVTGLVYADVLAALQVDPIDTVLILQFLEASLLDRDVGDLSVVLADIGGPDVIVAAAKAVADG